MSEPASKTWDIFISHASEDKESVARPLAEALSSFGLDVWYDEHQLQVGDSLSRSIDVGLSSSRFGVVVISEAFLTKNWPEYEYRGLVAKEINSGKVILPIWHEVDHARVLQFSPTLADSFALSTAAKSLPELALQILKSVRPDIHESVVRKIEYRRRLRESDSKQVNPKIIQPAPIIHETLPSHLLAQMKLVWLVVKEAYPCSFEVWIEGFQRDAHPSDELIIWQQMASAFLETKASKSKWNNEIANEVLSVLLFGVSSSREAAVGLECNWLSKREVGKIWDRYHTFLPQELEEELRGITEVTDEGNKHRSTLISVENLDLQLPDDFIRRETKER